MTENSINIKVVKGFNKTISAEQMCKLVSKQLNNLIPDHNEILERGLADVVPIAFNRIFSCFTWIKDRYYIDNNEVFFNHLHSDHYCSFLYLLSNSAFNLGAIDLATKIFLLNKYLHGVDLYFSIKLPEVYMLVHPVGTVIGNGQYDNFFVAYQNCTIGATKKDGIFIYPKFDKHVTMYAKSAVIGDCHIQKNVIIGANSFIINSKISSDSIVTGASPDLRIRKNENFKSPFFLD